MHTNSTSRSQSGMWSTRQQGAPHVSPTPYCFLKGHFPVRNFLLGNNYLTISCEVSKTLNVCKNNLLYVSKTNDWIDKTSTLNLLTLSYPDAVSNLEIIHTLGKKYNVHKTYLWLYSYDLKKPLSKQSFFLQ